MKHQQAPVPNLRALRPEVPDELEAVVRRMLAKQPEDRYATPAEVGASLKPFVDPQAVAALARRPAGSSTPEARRVGHRWRRPVAVAALLVPAALIGLFWLFGSRETRKEEGTAPEAKNQPVATSPVATELTGPFRVGRLGPTNLATHAAVSNEGRSAAYLADNRVYLWNKETQKERLLPLEDAEKTEAMAFSADGKYLGVLCARKVSVWSVDKAGEVPLLSTAGRSFAFAGNGQKLAVIAPDTSWLYDLNNPSSRSQLPVSDGSGALSEDGGLFAYKHTGPSGGTRVITKGTAAAAGAKAVGQFKEKVIELTFANRPILAVSENGHIHLFHLIYLEDRSRDKRNDCTFSLKAPSHVCFAGKGQLLVAVGASDQIHCWSVARRIQLMQWKLPGPIVSLAARDRVAAILLNDGRLYLLNLPEPAEAKAP